MPYLTAVVDTAMQQLDGSERSELQHFSHHVSGFVKFTVNFPDGSTRDTPDEEKAEELARIWLANRMGKQDDASWRPSRETLHDLGVTITGLLAVTY